MTLTAVTTTADARTLSIADVCDRCGYTEDTDSSGFTHHGPISQAHVLVSMPSGHDLKFCGHHYHVNELPLVAQGATVVADTRDSLKNDNRQQGDA